MNDNFFSLEKGSNQSIYRWSSVSFIELKPKTEGMFSSFEKYPDIYIHIDGKIVGVDGEAAQTLWNKWVEISGVGKKIQP